MFFLLNFWSGKVALHVTINFRELSLKKSSLVVSAFKMSFIIKSLHYGTIWVSKSLEWGPVFKNPKVQKNSKT